MALMCLSINRQRLPKALAQSHPSRPPVTARDLEVLGEDEYAQLLQAYTRRGIKCSCDGGGDLCKHIGVPPYAHVGAASSPSRTLDPLAFL